MHLDENPHLPTCVWLEGGHNLISPLQDWIAVCEKIGTERLIHEGMPDGQKTESCKSQWRFLSQFKCRLEPVKLVHEVLNRKSTWLLSSETGGHVLTTLEFVDIWANLETADPN